MLETAVSLAVGILVVAQCFDLYTRVRISQQVGAAAVAIAEYVGAEEATDGAELGALIRFLDRSVVGSSVDATVVVSAYTGPEPGVSAVPRLLWWTVGDPRFRMGAGLSGLTCSKLTDGAAILDEQLRDGVLPAENVVAVEICAQPTGAGFVSALYGQVFEVPFYRLHVVPFRHFGVALPAPA